MTTTQKETTGVEGVAFEPLVRHLAPGITVMLGDCMDYLPLECDAVVTDPPYGFKAYQTDDDYFVVSVLKSFDRKAVFGYPEKICHWAAQWGKPDEWVTWWPTNKFCGRSKGLPMTSEAIGIWGKLYEFPFRARANDATGKKIAEHYGRSVSECKDADVWRDPSPGMAFNSHLRLHPNEKPVSLMEKIVRLTSEENEIVADPYMGSGTTGVACIRAGRRFLGIELDPVHFETACERLTRELAQGRLF